MNRKLVKLISLNLRGYLLAIGSVALATWLKHLAEPEIIPTDVPILYFLAIVPTAIFFGLGPAILVCILSTLAYDYFFIPPFHSLNIFTANLTPIMAIFLVIGVALSYLGSNLRKRNTQLKNVKSHLEELVKERTSDLEKANLDLKQEIAERKETEQALIQEKDHAQQLLDIAGAIILEMDLEGTITLINAKGCEVLGYKSEEIIGRNWFSTFVPERIRSQSIAAHHKLNSSTEGWIEHFENPILNRQGEERLIAWHNSLVRDKTGQIIGTLSSGQDITEHKKAEAEIVRLARESAERLNELQLLLDNAPIGVWLARDPECRTITGNIFANWLFGVHAGDNISRSAKPEEVAIQYRVFRQGAELKPEELPAQVAASTGKAVIPYETEIVFENGRRLFMLIGSVPFVDKEGVVRGSIAIGTDITERKKAEEALQESNCNYRALFNNQTVALAYCQTIVDDHNQPIDYVVLDINSTYEKRVGIQREQIIGKRITEAFPGIAQDLINRHNRVAMTGEDSHFEIYEPSIDMWFDVTVYSPRRGYFVSLSYNITERKKAEEALKESEERFFKAFHSSPTASNISRVNDGYIVDVNEAFLRIFEYDREDIIGHNSTEFVPLIDGAEGAKLNDMFLQNGRITDLETSMKTRSGKLLTVLLAVERINLDGIDHSLNTIIDITERKKAEQALRETRDYLDNLLNYANAPIIVWGPDFGITQFNHAFERLTGRRASEVLGKNIDILFPEDKREQSMEYIRRTMSGERWETVEIPILHSNGTVRTLLWNSANLHDPGGRIIATIAQGQDITERKQAEESLQKYTRELEIANKEMEAFNYSISHDLRQPLRTLQSFSQLIDQEFGDKLDETAKDYLNRVIKASQYMSQLTDDMLRLSRISHSVMSQDKVNLTDIAQSIVQELVNRHPERRAKIDIDPNLEVTGDEGSLTIALRNLVENAWKFTSKQPLTSIQIGELNQDGEKVYFIRDNGIGLDMKYKDKLFQPFNRLQREFPGTGVGLAIVQRVIHRHGGKIWAESEVGKGTTFYFTLGENGENELE
jgi:PAS domain S-box-containing protein